MRRKRKRTWGEKQPKANVTFGWPWRTRRSEAVKFDRSLKKYRPGIVFQLCQNIWKLTLKIIDSHRYGVFVKLIRLE